MEEISRDQSPPEGWRTGRQLKAEGYLGNVRDFNDAMSLLAVRIGRGLVRSGIEESLAVDYVTRHLFRSARENDKNSIIYGSPDAIRLMEGSGLLKKSETAQEAGGGPHLGWTGRLPRSSISPDSDHLTRKGGQEK